MFRVLKSVEYDPSGDGKALLSSKLMTQATPTSPSCLITEKLGYGGSNEAAAGLVLCPLHLCPASSPQEVTVSTREFLIGSLGTLALFHDHLSLLHGVLFLASVTSSILETME